MGWTKKGGVAVESLLLLVTVVFTSAIIFYLIQSGIVAVEGSSGGSAASEQFLNVEFLPIEQGGTLAISDFSFCYRDDMNFEKLGCNFDRTLFFVGDEIHFSYEVISSSYLGEIFLTENYRVLGPNDEVILDVAAVNDIEYEAKAQVTFRDYFVLGKDERPGEYTLELIITNKLISKEAVLRKKITVLE